MLPAFCWSLKIIFSILHYLLVLCHTVMQKIVVMRKHWEGNLAHFGSSAQQICVTCRKPHTWVYRLTGDHFSLHTLTVIFICHVMSFMFGELTSLSALLKWIFAISRKHQVRLLKVYQATTSISQGVTTSILSNTNLNLVTNIAIIQGPALYFSYLCEHCSHI